MIIILFFLQSFSCSGFLVQNGLNYSITITELDKEQEFQIQNSYKGWCRSGLKILENTANDSIRIGHYLSVPAGKTGLLYIGDNYDPQPFTYKYIPYKANKGKVVIEWFIIPE